MNVASLELCKELYELSGWKTGTWWHNPYNLKQRLDLPKYSIGFLLRQLPVHIAGGKWSLMIWKGWHNGKGTEWYTFAYVHINSSFAQTPEGAEHKMHVVEDYTPENAAAKLCIELIKQGILTPTSKEPT